MKTKKKTIAERKAELVTRRNKMVLSETKKKHLKAIGAVK